VGNVSFLHTRFVRFSLSTANACFILFRNTPQRASFIAMRASTVTTAWPLELGRFAAACRRPLNFQTTGHGTPITVGRYASVCPETCFRR